MKFMKLALTFGTLALAIALAAAVTYHVTLDNAAWVGSSMLKAGDYRVEVEGDKAVFKSGKKDVAQVQVKVEQADHKFPTSQVLMRTLGDRMEVQEFRIGGSTTRIVILSSGLPTGN